MSTDVTDMDLQEKIDLIRSSLTPLDLADMFELEVHRDKIISPFNTAERTPSCHLYEDGWFDYGTGKHGDVIDLYRALTGHGLGRAVNRLLEGAQRMDADPDRVVRKPVELPDLTEQWDAEESGDWFIDDWLPRLSGVAEDELVALHENDMVKFQGGQLLIAHYHEHGIVRGIKIRSATGAKSAVPGSTFACGLYGTWHAVTPPPVAVIAEGESDCWALAGFSREADVYALPSGAGLWKDAWLEQLSGYDTIYTAFDNDRAGRNATEKVRKAIGWGRWRELTVPSLFNDCREAMAAGWEPKL